MIVWEAHELLLANVKKIKELEKEIEKITKENELLLLEIKEEENDK